MKKKLIMLTAIVTLCIKMVACGSDNTSSGEGMGGINEVNSSTNIATDSNENISANVPIEQETVERRIGKTLGELMDLSAYLEECKTLDVYKDSARELSDVLPFEIYELINGELINYYADGSETKTVKAASIEGTYGSVMVIKMDGSETFDIVMRATSDKYQFYNSCTYASLVDFKVIETNLTKEEVENMLYDNGILKEEYRHLLQGSAEVSSTGQTPNDYMATQSKQPRDFLLNLY